MTNIKATLGFLFTSDFKKVLLIKKQKPEPHKNKLNGLGGKVESSESDLACMVREVKEESGLVTNQEDWQRVGTLEWEGWDVVLFTAIYQGKSSDLKNIPDEVGWYPAQELPQNIISNLAWMIPLCLDALKNEKNLQVNIKYRK